ncbi:MAG: DNA/RNA nuclease SfsA [Bdellovibrionaceae bacterium]|nr:DNA/RNA nuclease SfsA [Pseudobdellovibrionaceae bacterium]
MKFPKKLYEGILLSRYKRFFADVEYKGEKMTIHVPNTGSLKSVIDKNAKEPQKVWFSLHEDPAKKLKGTLEAIQAVNGTWVGINTSNPNRIVTEAISQAIENNKAFLPHWEGYGFYKSEYKISKETRLDGAFFKTEDDFNSIKKDPRAKVKIHFIEIKNTTYLPDDQKKSIVQFPDGVSERAQKHLVEMMNLMKQGHQCEIIYTVQRAGAEGFSPCKAMDPVYANLFYKAVDAGLIVSPLVVEFDQNETRLTTNKLKII